MLGVLDLAAEKAGWGTPLPDGVGRGVSVQFAMGSYLSQVAEVEVSKEGEVRVRRVVCAVDCGQIVNPDTIVAQIEGGIIFGISAALWGEITLKDGRVEQHNFNDYRVLRINEAPQIEVHLVKSTRSAGRHRRAGHGRHRAGGGQCDLRRDRQAHPQAAHQGSIAPCIEFQAKAAMPAMQSGAKSLNEPLQKTRSSWRLSWWQSWRAGWWALRAGDPTAFAKGKRVELADFKGPDPTGAPASLADADLVARGEYLTRAADCAACHTAPGGKPFAGGLPFKLPMIGTIYSTNITPDPETGIGAWSDEEFLRALHRELARVASTSIPRFHIRPTR